MSSIEVARDANQRILSVATRYTFSDFKKLLVGCLICLALAGLFPFGTIATDRNVDVTALKTTLDELRTGMWNG